MNARAVSAESFKALLAEYESVWEAHLWKNLVRTMQDAFERLHTWLVVSWGENEYVRVDVTPEAGLDNVIRDRMLEPTSPALLTCWVPIQLSFEDAKSFQGELFVLLGRYQGSPERRAISHVLRLLRCLNEARWLYENSLCDNVLKSEVLRA